MLFLINERKIDENEKGKQISKKKLMNGYGCGTEREMQQKQLNFIIFIAQRRYLKCNFGSFVYAFVWKNGNEFYFIYKMFNLAIC